MDVINKIKEATDILDEIDEHFEGLNERLSEMDGRTQDLLHYIEEHNINILWAYKYIKELKRVRMERRQIKNDMAILYEFNKNKNKLISKDLRKFMLSDVYRREKQLNQPYKNTKYEGGEIENLLKKGSKNE